MVMENKSIMKITSRLNKRSLSVTNFLLKTTFCFLFPNNYLIILKQNILFKIKIYFICTYAQGGAHKPLNLQYILLTII